MPESEPAPDLPEPSAELILIHALVQAHLRTLSRKERHRFLTEVGDALGLQASLYNVIAFRPRSEDRRVFEVMRQAAHWWRHSLGGLLRMTD